MLAESLIMEKEFVSSISLKIAAEGQREKQAAFRPAHPSCLCLSCSTATLRAMFTVIRDGTFLHLARSSLLHLFFFFVFRQIFPQSSDISGGHPRVCTSVVCPHIWKRCSVRCIILGFKQLSRHSYTTSERGAAVSRPTATFLHENLG